MEKFYALAAKIIQVMPDWKYLPKDKSAHFVVGALLVLPFWLFGHGLFGLAVVTFVAFLKELLDYLRNRKLVKQGLPKAHGVSFWDFLATVAGGAVVAYADAAVKTLQALL